MATAFFASCRQSTSETKYRNHRGVVFGTSYNITYESAIDLEDSILRRLSKYDESMSVFNKNSLLSRINANETCQVDSIFSHIYRQAYEIHTLSDGAFDITVAPLSHLWRFDANHPDTISVAEFDSLARLAKDVKMYVGMEKTRLVDGQIFKDDPRIRFDANALAEGFGIDMAASVLEENGVQNYMVEIGGELHLKGKNPQGKNWRIGIDKPLEGVLQERENQHVIAVTNCAISTSGSYRQYYYRADGMRLSHTIDPSTGTPSVHSMISVTVVGPNTMTTDALSTACMIVGVDKAKELMSRRADVEAFMIYLDADGNEQQYMTPGYSMLIVK